MGVAGGGLVGTAKEGEDLECSVLSAATTPLGKKEGERRTGYMGTLLLFPQSLAKAELVEMDHRPGTPLSYEY
jgi:hypothetical protein